MFGEKKDFIAIGAFIALVVVIALANLSQSKDTGKFITRQTETETTEPEEDKATLFGDIHTLMATNLPAVALYAEPVDISKEELKTLVFNQTGTLVDVTNGQEIAGVQTNDEATGVVSATLKDNEYYLLSEMKDLPVAPDGYFYEGWLVREEPFRYESTGKLEMIDDTYTNIFGSTKDLSDHEFYVLTLEPDDSDPAPADHILEGLLSGQ